MVSCNKVSGTLRTAQTFAGYCKQVRNDPSNGTVHGIPICYIMVVMVNTPSFARWYTTALSFTVCHSIENWDGNGFTTQYFNINSTKFEVTQLHHSSSPRQ